MQTYWVYRATREIIAGAIQTLNLNIMFLSNGRKPEHIEKLHTDKEGIVIYLCIVLYLSPTLFLWQYHCLFYGWSTVANCPFDPVCFSGGAKGDAYHRWPHCPCPEHHRAHSILLRESGRHTNMQTTVWICEYDRHDSQKSFSFCRPVIKTLVPQMMEAHLSRDKAIKSCIAQTSEVVGQLREARAKDNDNLALIRQLRKEQTNVSPLPNTRGLSTTPNCKTWVNQPSHSRVAGRLWKTFLVCGSVRINQKTHSHITLLLCQIM